MRKQFLTPGPAELYFTVADHMKQAIKDQIPSISHRSRAFEEIFASTQSQLRKLLELPESTRIYFTASATEVWERITQELILKHSHHYVMGAFGQKFHEAAGQWNRTATAVYENFENTHVPPEADLIAITQNETSTGMCFPIEQLEALRAKTGAIIALDGVSALPGIPLPWHLVDTAYFSVQKAFGLPAGLGAWLLNERALERALIRSNPTLHSHYHDVASLEKFWQKNQTPETPNVLAIYLLGKVAEDLNRRGARIVQSETTFKSTLIYDVLDRHQFLRPAVSSSAYRSKTTIVVQSDMHSQAIRSEFAAKGLIVGSGYGARKTDQIRIANFPAHAKELFYQVGDLLENFN